MNVDWSKPIQTRDGDKARIVGAINYGNPREMTRVVVRVGENGKDFGPVWACYESGLHLGDSDIINVPPRKVMREVEAWAIIDGEDHEIMLATFNKAIADRNAGTSTVVRLTGTYEVEVEE